jgi:hypothetical protein
VPEPSDCTLLGQLLPWFTTTLLVSGRSVYRVTPHAPHHPRAMHCPPYPLTAWLRWNEGLLCFLFARLYAPHVCSMMWHPSHQLPLRALPTWTSSLSCCRDVFEPTVPWGSFPEAPATGILSPPWASAGPRAAPRPRHRPPRPPAQAAATNFPLATNTAVDSPGVPSSDPSFSSNQSAATPSCSSHRCRPPPDWLALPPPRAMGNASPVLAVRWGGVVWVG